MKKLSIVLLFLVISTTLSLTSCKKKSKGSNLPEYYIKAKIDGQEKVFANPTANILGNVVQFLALTSSGESIGFVFMGSNITDLEYTVNNENYSPENSSNLSGDISDEGEYFQGHFSGTLLGDNGGNISITEGEFKVKK